MMCYPAIDALVKKVDTKYTLVTMAALRARELTDGAPALLDDKGKKTVKRYITIRFLIMKIKNKFTV